LTATLATQGQTPEPKHASGIESSWPW
jgi:hypothetical protein